ncbi:carboxypeptidase-like regulatory domain-containing protein [Flagellimonas pacifica]|uniref:CarboxypepD_reg-like domain-containing protein n=1 Tax=Flagellimonas pacifica TaxID=1247520 RepID=A0A285MGV0_9FLAO|nr:carboxypeptidase-like regulatory domain-containing protein [Allomuricauda parva]SNY95186.1 CarboxypepD_reg-like domain-containing protein [Allomuricauda parva]
MTNITLSLFLLISCQVLSQETISGKIIDSESGLVLSYVNIGIADKGIGTISDIHGNFTLKLNEKVVLTDAIVFSHIGYDTRFIPVSVLMNSKGTIKLDSLETRLEEVVVKYKKPKAKKLGRSGKGLGTMHKNFYSYYEESVDDRLSKEMGVKFSIRKNCRVDALNFNITSNQFKSLKFRVNFYNLKNGLPDNLLNTRDIVFEIKNGQLGWFKVDLSSFDVYLEKEIEEVAVTIQWLESKKMNDKSKYFGISTKLATSKRFFYREKAMDKWFNGKSKPSFYLDAECTSAMN